MWKTRELAKMIVLFSLVVRTFAAQPTLLENWPYVAPASVPSFFPRLPASRWKALPGTTQGAANLRTRILDLRGFDSGRISISRGGNNQTVVKSLFVMTYLRLA